MARTLRREASHRKPPTAAQAQPPHHAPSMAGSLHDAATEPDPSSGYTIDDLTATDPLTACTRTYTHLENLLALSRPQPDSRPPAPARHKTAALEEILDIQLRSLHIKLAIERLHGLDADRQAHALAAAIEAADSEKGPFQPGTEGYELLLRAVARLACRREIGRLERQRARLETVLRGCGRGLEAWRARLGVVEGVDGAVLGGLSWAGALDSRGTGVVRQGGGGALGDVVDGGEGQVQKRPAGGLGSGGRMGVVVFGDASDGDCGTVSEYHAV